MVALQPWLRNYVSNLNCRHFFSPRINVATDLLALNALYLDSTSQT